jgi:hypothetical protein
VADEVVVDLARAQHEALDLLGRHPGLPEDGEELRLGEVLDAVGRLGQAQQRLRGQDDQRPLLGHPRLAAQEVEVLRRRRDVRDADVPLGGSVRKRSMRAEECSGPEPS